MAQITGFVASDPLPLDEPGPRDITEVRDGDPGPRDTTAVRDDDPGPGARDSTAVRGDNPRGETHVRPHKLRLSFPYYTFSKYQKYLKPLKIDRSLSQVVGLGRDYENQNIAIHLVDKYISRHMADIGMYNNQFCIKNISKTSFSVDSFLLKPDQVTELWHKSRIRFEKLHFAEEFRLNYIEFVCDIEMSNGQPDEYLVELVSDDNAPLFKGVQEYALSRAPWATRHTTDQQELDFTEPFYKHMRVVQKRSVAGGTWWRGDALSVIPRNPLDMRQTREPFTSREDEYVPGLEERANRSPKNVPVPFLSQPLAASNQPEPYNPTTYGYSPVHPHPSQVFNQITNPMANPAYDPRMNYSGSHGTTHGGLAYGQPATGLSNPMTSQPYDWSANPSQRMNYPASLHGTTHSGPAYGQPGAGPFASSPINQGQSHPDSILPGILRTNSAPSNQPPDYYGQLSANPVYQQPQQPATNNWAAGTRSGAHQHPPQFTPPFGTSVHNPAPQASIDPHRMTSESLPSLPPIATTGDDIPSHRPSEADPDEQRVVSLTNPPRRQLSRDDSGDSGMGSMKTDSSENR